MNIGPAQRRKRLFMAVFMFVLASVMAVWFVRVKAPLLWRLALGPLFFIAMLGFFQVHAKTCVVLAAQGIQNLDRKNEKIENAELLNLLRRRSYGILIRSAVVAVFLTALCLAAH